MATIQLRIERLCSSEIAAGCDGGKKTSVGTLLAGYSAISVRTIAYIYILVKNSHQIRNQHLRFTLELLNDPEVTRAFAEIRSGEYSTRCHKRNSYFGKIAFPYVYYGQIINPKFARA